jgi:TolB-like protein/AraC-like DNA-binding protein/Flp pilus assembly protein TadD
MNQTLSMDQVFLNKIIAIIEDNLANDKFGAAELSHELGMSHSNINRKLRSIQKKTISQLIQEIRLQHAREMLQEKVATASEIAFRVGFSSPAYFNKCFHDYYGYPPGEVKKREPDPAESETLTAEVNSRPDLEAVKDNKMINRKKTVQIVLGILAILIVLYFLYPIIRPETKAGNTGSLSDKKSLAVLPISDYTGDPENAYIADGMHDALIGELGKISNLTVRSRTSTLRYRDRKNMSIQQIAKELGVDDVVEASVLCSGDSICILVQLIEPFPEEKHIWSNSYQQNFASIMSLYRNATETIAEKIKIELTPREKAHLAEGRMVNADLYKDYTRGTYYMNKSTPEGFETGLRYLNEAIAMDPAEPLPYVALAVGYSNTSHISSAGTEAPKLAKAYAEKALELDSTLAEPYAVLATHYLYHEWNWKATENALKNAIRLNPNIPSVHYTYGWYHFLFGEKDDAISEMKRAVNIDPLNPTCTGYLAWIYLWTGDYDEAVTAAKRTLDLDPASIMALYVMGSAYAELGKFELAIETQKKGIAISPDYKCGLGVTYARAGQRKNALAITAELEREKSSWNSWGLADIYASLGDKDKAIYWVKAAYDQHSDFTPWNRFNPNLKPLHNDPRFQDISHRLNLPD